MILKRVLNMIYIYFIHNLRCNTDKLRVGNNTHLSRTNVVCAWASSETFSFLQKLFPKFFYVLHCWSTHCLMSTVGLYFAVNHIFPGERPSCAKNSQGKRRCIHAKFIISSNSLAVHLSGGLIVQIGGF